VNWAAEGVVRELIERDFFPNREREFDPPMCHSSKRKHVTFKVFDPTTILRPSVCEGEGEVRESSEAREK
jgi:hypothetical protein